VRLNGDERQEIPPAEWATPMPESTKELREELTELLKQVQRIEGRLRFLLDHLVEQPESKTGDTGK